MEKIGSSFTLRNKISKGHYSILLQRLTQK